MAYTAYICRIRTDMDDSSLQVTDLKPNTSQRSLIYEPVGQTGYVGSRVDNDTLAALSGTDTVAEYTGLAAYLIDNVIDGVTSVTITVTVANAAAVGLIAIMDAGTALSEAAINASIIATGGAGAGTDINAGGSTGSVIEILQIMAGRTYTLPSGSTVGGESAGAQLGSFSSLATDGMREVYLTGALQISCGAGQLAGFADSTFTYSSTTGAALVVYDYLGAVLT